MSKLENLIAELCPDGVEYVPIGDCLEKTKNIRWIDNQYEIFNYIDLTSVDRDTHQITPMQSINYETAPSRAQQIVKKGDVLLGTTRPMLKRYCLIDDKYDEQICSTGFCVLRAKIDMVLQKWILHQISSTEFFTYVEKYQKGASYPAISDAEVKGFRIPLPPLPIQEEIVRILDNFTELTARKQQYEYYRQRMLSHKHLDICEEMTLEEIYDFQYGKGNVIPTSGGCYPVYGSNGIVGDHSEYNNENSPVWRR